MSGMPWDGALGLWGKAMDNNFKQSGTQTGTQTTKRNISQAAIDKMIYDVLSSDQGLASLASGEGLSGGFNSSTKTLQTQDFLTKLIGELAIATSEQTVETDLTTSQEKTTKEGRFLNKFADNTGTVICTELARQGLLWPELYEAGGPASRQVSYTTWSGYHSWAVHVVTRMQKSPALSMALLPIVVSRYRYLTGEPGLHILGRLSVWVGHPICYLIGTVINWRGGYGRANEFA